MPLKSNTEEFITKANKIHNNKYDYSKVNYINSNTPVIIICPLHGEFQQRPNYHLQGWSCHKCAYITSSSKCRLSADSFIIKANKIHNNKYDYSKINYINRSSKVEIICPVHGSFKQAPINHLQGWGCKRCASISAGLKQRQSLEAFIYKANKVHNNKYDYSKVNYINSSTKVEIVCPIHGSFWQQPGNHTFGDGCPGCRESKGEEKIGYYLSSKNISFTRQKSFNTCKYEGALLFDFYLPDYNICIEYDGIQHFHPVDFFGGLESFKKQQKRDLVKNNFCKNNNIKLIRISYMKYKNIESILEKEVM